MAEHEIEIVVAPERVDHGSQSTITGGCSARKGQICALACWLAESIRWVLMTPLGSPVDPDVKSSLAIVSGPTARAAAATRGPSSARTSSENGTTSFPSPGEPDTTVPR